MRPLTLFTVLGAAIAGCALFCAKVLKDKKTIEGEFVECDCDVCQANTESAPAAPEESTTPEEPAPQASAAPSPESVPSEAEPIPSEEISQEISQEINEEKNSL